MKYSAPVLLFIMFLTITTYGNEGIFNNSPLPFLTSSTVNICDPGIRFTYDHKLDFRKDPIKIYGEGKTAIWKSAIIPGWGMATASGNNKWFLAAPICYGLIGYGIYSNVQSKNAYNDYSNSLDQTEMDDFYEKANQKRGSFFRCTAFGVGAYVMQLGATILYAHLNDFYRKRNSRWKTSSVNWSMAPTYDFKSKHLDFTLTLNL